MNLTTLKHRVINSIDYIKLPRNSRLSGGTPRINFKDDSITIKFMLMHNTTPIWFTDSFIEPIPEDYIINKFPEYFI